MLLEKDRAATQGRPYNRSLSISQKALHVLDRGHRCKPSRLAWFRPTDCAFTSWRWVKGLWPSAYTGFPITPARFVTSPAQQRRSWYMFFFQMPFAEDAVTYNDFAFIERIWQDWSPGWSYPAEEMASLKETFGKPGVLQAALGYYRHTLNPANHVPALAGIQDQLFSAPIQVPTLFFHGEKDGCIGVELSEGMESHFTKGLRKVIVPGAGHFIHQEKPDEINRVLVEFLKQ